MQMPVDVNTQTAVFAAKNPLRWAIPFHHSSGDEENSIMYNGHTVEITPSLSAYVFYDGKKYKLVQFHFHTPSENRIDGHAFASEVHLVHQAADGSLMVTSAAAACRPSLSRFIILLQVFGVLVHLNRNEQGFEEGADELRSPLNAVFEALPVLANRVVAQHKSDAHSEHAASDEMPLLGFSLKAFLDHLMSEQYSTKCAQNLSIAIIFVLHFNAAPLPSALLTSRLLFLQLLLPARLPHHAALH
jgi:hypothetical protein